MEKALSYFARTRQDFIKEHLRKNKTINRSVIKEKFEISDTGAYLDLKVFQKENPGVLEYDAVAKTYKKVK